MPLDAVPLEKDLVERIRGALEKLGYLTWSGRVAIYDRIAVHRDRSLGGPRSGVSRDEEASDAAREARIARGWPPFIPALGTGCPDILGVMPDRGGRLFGLECKRAESDKERVAQVKWREMASYWGIPCATVRTVDEAVEYLEVHRGRR